MGIFQELLRDEGGATAIEYGLIVALIALSAIAALGAMSSSLQNIFNTAGNKMTNANGPSG